jgi:ferritin-like metal-binding protein YciE
MPKSVEDELIKALDVEIAAYRLIEELARRAGDQQSLAVARQNAEDEERMAARIAANWSTFVALSLSEEGAA